MMNLPIRIATDHGTVALSVPAVTFSIHEFNACSDPLHATTGVGIVTGGTKIYVVILRGTLIYSKLMRGSGDIFF